MGDRMIIRLNPVKLTNLAIILLGAIFVGLGSGSWLIGIGVALVGFGLMPND